MKRPRTRDVKLTIITIQMRGGLTWLAGVRDGWPYKEEAIEEGSDGTEIEQCTKHIHEKELTHSRRFDHLDAILSINGVDFSTNRFNRRNQTLEHLRESDTG